MQVQNIETVNQKRLSGTALTMPLSEDDYCAIPHFEEWPLVPQTQNVSQKGLSGEKTSAK